MPMQPPVTVALVGLAGYGEAYLKAIWPDNDRRVRLVAGVDPRPDASAFHETLLRRGVPIFPSLDAFWASDVGRPELVILATPIHLHRAQTIAALERGCHVLCEKPIAGDVAEALAMRDAAARHPDRVVSIGYQWSFSDAVQRCKRDMLAGRFGRAIRFRTLLTMPRPLHYFTRNRWAGRLLADDGAPVYDSPANNAAAHHLHNMLYLGGHAVDRALTPTRVTAELARVNAIENYDTAAIRVETAEGTEVLFYTSHATTKKVGPTASFEFERATVAFDQAGDGRLVATLADGTRVDYGDPDADKFEKLWQTAAAVRDPAARPVVCGVEAALPHARVVASAQRSAPIATPPDDAIDAVEQDGETYRTIDGITDALSAAFAAGTMPSATGRLPWLAPGRAADVDEPARAGDRKDSTRSMVSEGAK